MHFWRTRSGLEVDFVLGDGEVAIEVKGTSRVDRRDLRGIAAFVEDCAPKTALIVCNETEERMAGPIRIVPWRACLTELWAAEIIR